MLDNGSANRDGVKDGGYSFIEVNDGVFDVRRYSPAYAPFTIGRAGDIAIGEDDLSMHRLLLQVFCENGVWKLKNIGSRTAVTLTSKNSPGFLRTTLGPNSAAVTLPVGESEASWYGKDSEYGVDFRVTGQRSEAPEVGAVAGADTRGSVDLPYEQRLLVHHLTKEIQDSLDFSSRHIPTVAQLAKIIGLSEKAINRKIERICEKYATIGVIIEKPYRQNLAKYLVMSGEAARISRQL